MTHKLTIFQPGQPVTVDVEGIDTFTTAIQNYQILNGLYLGGSWFPKGSFTAVSIEENKDD